MMMEEKSHIHRNLSQNENGEKELGQSVGLICLTDKMCWMVCSFCRSAQEFNEALSFVSHVKSFHSSIVSSKISKETVINNKKEVIDKSTECQSISLDLETETYMIIHDDYLAEKRLKPIQNEKSNDILEDYEQKTTTKNQFLKCDKNIGESFNAVDIHSQKFFCSNCKSNFNCKNELLQHICSYDATKPETHPDQHKFYRQLNSSDKSKELPTTRDEQLLHLIKNKNTNKIVSNGFNCNQYKKDFQSEDKMRQHIYLKPKAFVCRTCDRSFTRKDYLKKHMRTHHAKKLYKCEYNNCNRSFVRSNSLVYHMRCHTGEKPFKCKLCPLTFRSKGNLIRHIANHFTCEVCQLTFNRKDKLTVHMVKHTNKSFKCELEECCLPYVTIASLLKHQALCHEKPKIIQCPQCDETFRLSRDLNHHLASKHGCPLCLKAYGPLSNLEKHLLTCIENKS